MYPIESFMQVEMDEIWNKRKKITLWAKVSPLSEACILWVLAASYCFWKVVMVWLVRNKTYLWHVWLDEKAHGVLIRVHETAQRNGMKGEYVYV